MLKNRYLTVVLQATAEAMSSSIFHDLSKILKLAFLTSELKENYMTWRIKAAQRGGVFICESYAFDFKWHAVGGALRPIEAIIIWSHSLWSSMTQKSEI